MKLLRSVFGSKFRLIAREALPGAAALLATLAMGSSASASLPENKLPATPNLYVLPNEVDEIMRNVRIRLAGLVANQGAELVFENKWDSPTINAYAWQDGKRWIVQMHGGLTGRPELTADGMALVLCHELGHHLAGYPFFQGPGEPPDTLSAEGMADFYAAHVCAPTLWRFDKAVNAKSRTLAPANVRARCDREYATADEQNLCYRITMAGKALADLLATINGESLPRFGTDDTSNVSTTYFSHPKAQCRLDTYEAGALCTIPPNVVLVPGLKLGAQRNGVAAEREAAVWSCLPASAGVGAKNYNRQDLPGCWFKPQVR
jgi:hypothetical protein